jgi:hypothetical protein
MASLFSPLEYFITSPQNLSPAIKHAAVPLVSQKQMEEFSGVFH